MTYRYLLIAAWLAGAAAPLSAQSVKAGIDAWQHANYAGAVAAWRPLAEKGDADAQFNLAQAYRLGRGVPTNLAAAKTWFERAARQGHVDARTTLGLLMFQNGDQAGGLKWLKQAAEQGEPRAQLVYGTALVNGDGVTQDPSLGYAFVSRAAASGLQAAKSTLDQLNEVIPIADRKRGTQIAAGLAKAPAVAASVAGPPAPAPRKPKKATPAAPGAIAAPMRVAAAPAPRSVAPKAVAAVPAATGGWRIQLGAFGQKGSAQALYQRLSGRPAVAGRQPFYTTVGSVTRLQVGPFASRAAAEAACRATAVPCFPVPAK